jgi:tetratricopeptide (TPR) repeat protein
MARIVRPFMISMVLALAAPLGAQVPDTFTNLQVMPKDIERRALVDAMRGFCGALGVRCIHCHVGENEDTLEGFDFASDDKETKRVARAMLRMTHEINDTLLPKTGRDNLLAVSCITCHHGLQKPQRLREVLAAELEKGGVDAVGVKYRELHEKYYGKAAYDFGEFTLTSLAESVARDQDDPATALALLDLNAELHPESAYTHIMKGRILARTGDRDAAIRSTERALEIDPESDWAKRQLERLKAPPSDG